MAEESHKVSLNVYDLSQGLARQLSTTFLGKVIEGVWHTGVVVYGNEYYFGGGIQHVPAGKSPYGTPVRVVDLGTTHLPKDVFESYLQEISHRYTEQTYSLLTHNCNNFSNEVAQFLVGSTIPDYILDLPKEVMNSPGGALFLPMIQQLETTLKAGSVPHAPQFIKPAAAPATQATSSVNNTNESRQQSEKDSSVASGGEKMSKDEITPSAGKPASEQEKPSPSSFKGDPLGDARSKVQEEIGQEFKAIMATGAFRASEAAAMATKRVMVKYGYANTAQS